MRDGNPDPRNWGPQSAHYHQQQQQQPNQLPGLPTATPVDPPRHFHVSEDILLKAFRQLQREDSQVISTAHDAFLQMESLPYDAQDFDPRSTRPPPDGLVQRRAPLNPLRSPLMGKFRKQERRKPKISDPALQGNPLRGRLVVTFLTTGVIFFLYLQSLILSFTETRQAHGGAGSIPGPAAIVLEKQGGLNTNKVRAGEAFRLFWAVWLHADWMHVIFNLLCQLQFLLMLEPDWGIIRTFVIFYGSAITGNLLSCVGDPCSITVGSSGGLFGLMGAMFPYWIEYWKSIPRPGLIVLFTSAVTVASIIMGFTSFGGNTDNWTHLGGAASGLFLGMGTITSLTACEDFSCRSLWKRKVTANSPNNNNPESLSKIPVLTDKAPGEHIGQLVVPGGKIPKSVVKRNQMARTFQRKLQPSCKCGAREWTCRLVSWGAFLILLLVLIWLTFIDYKFQPTGHLSFSGIRSCCCCNSKSSVQDRELWTCYYCDELINGVKWKDYCKAELDQSLGWKSYIQKTTGIL